MENEAANNLKHNLGDRMRRTRQTFDEMRAETQAKARRAVRITNNYAHDHPWRMVATGAALALTVGLLMRKSPRRNLARKISEAPAQAKKLKASSGSRWDAVHAFLPIALFAAKALMTSRAKSQVEPEPEPVAEI